jgi:hypothetical protein
MMNIIVGASSMMVSDVAGATCNRAVLVVSRVRMGVDFFSLSIAHFFLKKNQN